jgi:hypothetical protein
MGTKMANGYKTYTKMAKNTNSPEIYQHFPSQGLPQSTEIVIFDK